MKEFEYIKDIINVACKGHVSCFSSCDAIQAMSPQHTDKCEMCAVNLIVWAFKRGQGYAEMQQMVDLSEVASIEGFRRMLDDYKYVVEKYPLISKSIHDILSIIKTSEAGTFGIDTTDGEAYRRCYTFEKKDDGQVLYLGLWKC